MYLSYLNHADCETDQNWWYFQFEMIVWDQYKTSSLNQFVVDLSLLQIGRYFSIQVSSKYQFLYCLLLLLLLFSRANLFPMPP